MKISPCCISLPLGGMIIAVLEMIGSGIVTLLSAGVLITVAIVVSTEPTSESLDADAIKELKEADWIIYSIWGITAAVGIISFINAMLLLIFGILKKSVSMMKTWCIVKAVTTGVVVGLTVTVWIRFRNNSYFASYNSIAIIRDIYCIWVIRALAEQTKFENAVAPLSDANFRTVGK